MAETTERWLPVVGYEGYYEVSDHGQVRSLDRDIQPCRKCGHPYRVRKGKLLKPHNNRGILKVGLSRTGPDGTAGRQKNHPVHQLVMRAFVGPTPAGMEIRHGPGGGLDNRLPNLSFGTHLQNMRDKVRDGTQPFGPHPNFTKLTPDNVLEIRRRITAGETQTALAAEFGVCSKTVSCLWTRRSWAHI